MRSWYGRAQTAQRPPLPSEKAPAVTLPLTLSATVIYDGAIMRARGVDDDADWRVLSKFPGLCLASRYPEAGWNLA